MTKLQQKPFALVGVNIMNHDPESLKEIMVKEKLNWRSFAHGDEIAKQWNSPPTPAFYVIDTKGTIRRKWVGHPGESAIDAALNTLIAEAERLSGDRPK